tara:strand:- start:241 stop:510 length:270 start_codon:yes stop_codon:yes gene_type:complete
MERVHIFVYGKVQMVNFRYYIKEKADKLNLKGWIKNNEDGSVEAVFEGQEKNINDITKFCKKGPSSAKVNIIKITEEKPENLQEFKIIR